MVLSVASGQSSMILRERYNELRGGGSDIEDVIVCWVFLTPTVALEQYVMRLPLESVDKVMQNQVFRPSIRVNSCSCLPAHTIFWDIRVCSTVGAEKANYGLQM